MGLQDTFQGDIIQPITSFHHTRQLRFPLPLVPHGSGTPTAALHMSPGGALATTALRAEDSIPSIWQVIKLRLKKAQNLPKVSKEPIKCPKRPHRQVYNHGRSLLMDDVITFCRFCSRVLTITIWKCLMLLLSSSWKFKISPLNSAYPSQLSTCSRKETPHTFPCYIHWDSFRKMNFEEYHMNILLTNLCSLLTPSPKSVILSSGPHPASEGCIPEPGPPAPAGDLWWPKKLHSGQKEEHRASSQDVWAQV